MKKYHSRPVRQINLDTFTTLKLTELIIPLIVGFIAYLIFALSVETSTPLFADATAKETISSRLSGVLIFFVVISILVYIAFSFSAFRTCKTPPEKLISSIDLMKRWQKLSEDEIGLIVLASTPSIFKFNSKRTLNRVIRIYCIGDIAAKIRKIFKDSTYQFDLSEIESIEQHSSFLSFVVEEIPPSNAPSKKMQPSQSEQTQKATTTKQAKRLESVKEWPLHTSQILLRMIDSPRPKKRFSEDNIETLVQAYCDEIDIPFDGNKLGLSKSFIIKTWFKSLPDEFQILKSTEK